MTQYKILIDNRNYDAWSIHDPITFKEIYKCNSESIDNIYNINPLSQKYFNKDIFEITTENEIKLLFSPIKEVEQIAGILVLNGNKTYGRSLNKKKLLYKCIPDDKRLPIFLIPYEIKASFSKNYLNKYVLFRYNNWDNKQPQGILVNSLGDVDKLDAFYEYQLYRKSLQVSMTELLEHAKSATKEKNTIDELIQHNSNFMLEDRTITHRVFTIDNNNTVDFDDGISIKYNKEDNTNIISIYISNVFFIIETLKLWSSLTKRVSTIYLPDRRRPMIPSFLSDNFCSLCEGKKRFTFVCDFIIKNNEIIDIKFNNAYVLIDKNYKYTNVINDKDYNIIYNITNKLDKCIKTPNDIIAFWMIKMNSICAEKMILYKNGIYKSGGYIIAPHNLHNFLPENQSIILDETRRVIYSWNNTSSQYMLFQQYIPHEFIGKTYTHITSPIRRLVDLLNQTIFLQNIGLVKNISIDAIHFLDKWLSEIEYINTSMRSIKKIQTDCFLLQKITENPEILEKEYYGVVFDKLIKGDGGLIYYMVYLEEIKLLSRFSILFNNTNKNNIMENYEKRKFKIFLFEDKDNLRKKIRLQLIEQEHALDFSNKEEDTL